jgi:flavin-dependent dehydrogenase
MYDIAIIGAGPAGSTLARLLATKYRILLIDKRDLGNEVTENGIVKCCGGLLAPDAQHMIAKLGLGIMRDILVEPQLFTVRTIDLNNNIERFYQRFYLNMDREKFDRWLVSLIPSGVELRFNSLFKGFKKESYGYEITYTHNNKEYKEKVKVLIGADGGNSRIRKLVFNNQKEPNKYISIQEWFEAEVKCLILLQFLIAVLLTFILG